MDLKRLIGSTVILGAIPVFSYGCSDLCCTDFVAGADLSNVDWKVEGEAGAKYKVLAQASADLAGAANGALTDVTDACRNIAVDLGATNEEVSAADGQEGDAQVGAMCDLAVGKIQANLGASVKLTVAFTPPQCEASISAKANCQANCSVDAKCDIKATPPTCEGGKLEVSCKGSCQGSATAEVECSGSCNAECTGSCTAQGGVECAGKCDGTCTAGATADQNGIQADGTCKGTCSGTCSVTPPGVTCTGTCSGGCKGTCSAEAGASIKCDGTCSGEFEPISCKGGTLKGGCQVDAECDANCDASVNATASCTPPSLDIKASAAVTANVQAVIDTLKVNLPAVIVVLKVRGQALIDLTGQIAGSLDGAVSGDLSAKGTACLIPMTTAVAKAVGSSKATFDASVKLSGAAGVN